MGESVLHLSLKQIVLDELHNLGFQVEVEPEYPPCESLNWRNYRPDLVGILKTPKKTQFIIVECETQPSKARFIKKNWSKIDYQSKLFEDTFITFILAVPTGRISSAVFFRRLWEIWQINMITKEIWKIPKC